MADVFQAKSTAPSAENADANVERDNTINSRIDKFWRIAIEGRQYHEARWFRNCLDGDTRIPTLEGFDVAIRDLAGMENVWVYGFDVKRGRIVPAKLTKCWSSGERECVKVTLDDGSSFICTADHPVLAWFKGYVSAGELKKGDSLVPLYRGDRKLNYKKSYEALFQPIDCRWEMTHRLVATEHFGYYPKGLHVHHVNDNQRDNRPGNLQILTPSQHTKVSFNKESILAGQREYWNKPENRQRRSINAKKQWRRMRGKMRKAIARRYDSPEYVQKLSRAVRAYWDSDRPYENGHIAKLKGKNNRQRKAEALITNHRVVSVEPVGRREVFDATVETTNNFALSCGIFVHNCKFQDGEHWIRIDRTTNTLQPVTIPDKFPRVTVNKFGQINNDLIGFLTGDRVPMSAEPSTEDREDSATADIANRFKEVFEEEAGVDEIEDELAAWCVLTGNAFLDPYYDYDKKHGTRKFAQRKCDFCPFTFKEGQHDESQPCPQCGSVPPPGASPEPVAPSPDGILPPPLTEAPIDQPAYIDTEPAIEPVGKLCTDVLSPFEVFVDNSIRHWKDHTRYIVARRYPEQFAKDYWKLADVPTDSVAGQSQSLKYLEQLSYTLRPISEGKQVTVFRYYEAPSDEYPNGLMITRVGSKKIVDIADLPYAYGGKSAKAGKKFLSIVPVQTGDVLPGIFWRRPRADDLISPQQKLNLCWSALKATAQRMGNPVWLDPEGSGMKNVTGGMGQIIRFRPVSANGTTVTVPTRVEATLGNVGPYLELAGAMVAEMEKMAGTFFLAGGDVPSGVTAASALSYLGERSVRALASMKRKWAKAWKKWTLTTLEIMRANVTEERIAMIRGRGNRWKAQKFLGASLEGSVNMRIDWEALMPKSEAAKRATLSELVRLGAINPQDPEQQRGLLEEFGLLSMRPSASKDVETAALEYDKFMESGEIPILIPMVDDPMVHLMQHADDCKSEEFRELNKVNPQLAQQFINHIMAHATEMIVRRQTFTPQEGSEAGGAPSKEQGSVAGSGQQDGATPAPIRKGRDAAASENSLAALSGEIPVTGGPVQ